MSGKKSKQRRRAAPAQPIRGRADIGRIVAGELDENCDPELRADGLWLLRVAAPELPDLSDEALLDFYRRLRDQGWLRLKDGVAYLSAPGKPDLLAPMNSALVTL